MKKWKQEIVHLSLNKKGVCVVAMQEDSSPWDNIRMLIATMVGREAYVAGVLRKAASPSYGSLIAGAVDSLFHQVHPPKHYSLSLSISWLCSWFPGWSCFLPILYSSLFAFQNFSAPLSLFIPISLLLSFSSLYLFNFLTFYGFFILCFFLFFKNSTPASYFLLLSFPHSQFLWTVSS